ncbi:aldehyde dehydrogenase family protein [Desulfofustis glycolicus]|uniref:methylmalonate-semialdehyde dehydrogenase (CoA acylating) n=1 Tax=Desulfofustis glycolicus DSM 9705 TaxID=1121409 RepID=A0A1M5SNK3_9BACT|nr:aldehyde dehydrogenase family protein [Desulfofustis glycolicus]MCB2215619.1 aldehyde dehydrogenase family protein [Desulfobulbaceae bacterium]SHH40117.1 malonate-semialdehyde dehydrogenase (acetylating) / methylmalonate-semialdehyde dehydrogenase [Desulfofustis glycolicus DSM 9705]
MSEIKLNNPVKNFIHGEWMEETGVEMVPVYNPSTGEQISAVPLTSEKTSLEAVDSAYSAYDPWRKLSVAKRMAYLYDLRQAIIDHEEELAVIIATDQAKHVSEARGEVRRIVEIFEMACTIPALLQGETLHGISTNISGRIIKEPLGVFGGVAPFNFPALVFAWFVPFAIGAGNTFIFKPSTQSPLFMQKIGELFQAVGLPKGVVNIVHGNRSIPGTWYEHQKMSGVCLVGSTPTAKKMAEACGRGGKRSMLLGGAKNILAVMEDAQADVFIDNFIHSCFGSAGQRCLAGSIVAVVPEIYDSFVEKMIAAGKKIKIGDALDPDVYMGPVISAQAKKKIEQYIEIGIKEGSNLVLDGRNPDIPAKNKNGYFVGPTIFEGVTPCRTIAKEEIFGPVISVMKIRDLDDVLEIIRAQPFGNGACIFTQNQYYTDQFIAEANVGMVGVNVGICAPHPYLPFGGIKDSHLGTNKVQGKDGIDFFTQNKVATVRVAPPSGTYVAGESASASTEKKASPAVRSCVAQ